MHSHALPRDLVHAWPHTRSARIATRSRCNVVVRIALLTAGGACALSIGSGAWLLLLLQVYTSGGVTHLDVRHTLRLASPLLDGRLHRTFLTPLILK